jgi:hypothetical protein
VDYTTPAHNLFGPAYSSDNAGDGPTSSTHKKRTQNTTRKQRKADSTYNSHISTPLYQLHEIINDILDDNTTLAESYDTLQQLLETIHANIMTHYPLLYHTPITYNQACEEIISTLTDALPTSAIDDIRKLIHTMVPDNTAQHTTTNFSCNSTPNSTTTSTTSVTDEPNRNDSHISTPTINKNTRNEQPSNASLTNDAYDRLSIILDNIQSECTTFLANYNSIIKHLSFISNQKLKEQPNYTPEEISLDITSVLSKSLPITSNNTRDLLYATILTILTGNPLTHEPYIFSPLTAKERKMNNNTLTKEFTSNYGKKKKAVNKPPTDSSFSNNVHTTKSHSTKSSNTILSPPPLNINNYTTVNSPTILPHPTPPKPLSPSPHTPTFQYYTNDQWGIQTDTASNEYLMDIATTGYHVNTSIRLLYQITSDITQGIATLNESYSIIKQHCETIITNLMTYSKLTHSNQTYDQACEETILLVIGLHLEQYAIDTTAFICTIVHSIAQTNISRVSTTNNLSDTSLSIPTSPHATTTILPEVNCATEYHSIPPLSPLKASPQLSIDTNPRPQLLLTDQTLETSTSYYPTFS